jgi:hypothetical protein
MTERFEFQFLNKCGEIKNKKYNHQNCEMLVKKFLGSIFFQLQMHNVAAQTPV